MPAQVGFEVGQRLGFQYLVHLVKKRGLADDYLGRLAQLPGRQQALRVQHGVALLGIGHRQLVVVGLRVAQLYAGAAGLRQAGFEALHGGRVALGQGRGIAQQPKQGGHVSAVGRLHLLAARIGLEVEVPVGQRQAALVELYGILRGLFLVYFYAGPE